MAEGECPMTTKYGYETERWNPIIGCSPVNEGCHHCWARSFARRLAASQPEVYGPIAAWDGTTRLIESRLAEPLHWRKPRRIAVSFMGDLFHPTTPEEWQRRVFKTISECRQHSFLLLTKRPENAARLFAGVPLHPNMWMGISVSNQHNLDQIAPDLLAVNAAVRWLSVEPMLAPIDLRGLPDGLPNWVVCGPETGPGARPCDPKWIEDIADQCAAADVAFWDKRGTLRQELPR